MVQVMIKSRCGIVCAPVKCKKAFGFDCLGCPSIKAAPWGNCEIKNCCESKKHEHCGMCTTFPCDTLTQYANDEEHGDGGARIEQCRKWAEDATK